MEIGEGVIVNDHVVFEINFNVAGFIEDFREAVRRLGIEVAEIVARERVARGAVGADQVALYRSIALSNTIDRDEAYETLFGRDPHAVYPGNDYNSVEFADKKLPERKGRSLIKPKSAITDILENEVDGDGLDEIRAGQARRERIPEVGIVRLIEERYAHVPMRVRVNPLLCSGEGFIRGASYDAVWFDEMTPWRQEINGELIEDE